MYIYPDNLKAKATMWLWGLKDLAIVGIIILFSVFAFAYAGVWFPLVIAGAYALSLIHIWTSKEISKVCTGRICGVGVIPKIPEWGLGDMESGVPWRSAGGNSETWRRIQPSEDRIQRRFKVL